MTSDIARALNQIEQGLAELGRTWELRLLKPGLEPVHVREVLESCGLSTTGELDFLYGWRNGTDTAHAEQLGDIYLFPGFYFLSIEDAATNFRAFVTDSRWSAGWWPLFADGGGDFYVLDFGGGAAGCVRHFRNEDVEHPVEFESIGAMLATVAAGFEQGVFFVDREGYLEMEDLSFAAVAAAHNPRIPWWTD